MAPDASFDVGVTSEAVSDALRQSSAVAIVGFRGSGKSKLAEILHFGLRAGRKVIMQTASSWLQGRGTTGHTHSDASVDPEIINVMDTLERAPTGACWIVDDAEVMLAYATDRVLENLGDRLRRRQFSLVLIRNRFVMEGEGWFHQRQRTVAENIPKLTMHPMPPQAARDAASAMYRGGAQQQQAEWLASMSGGIPGLMTALHPYTPEWPPQPPDAPLLRFAARTRHELELERPLRRSLVRALTANVLPPAAFLTDEARRELGVLQLAGMVSSDYACRDSAFNGDFWRLVCDGEGTGGASGIDNPHETGALSLESMIASAGLLDAVKGCTGVEDTGDGALAQAFAFGRYCERNFSPVSRAVENVLGESLGRYGLLKLLETRNALPPRSEFSLHQLVQRVFEITGL